MNYSYPIMVCGSRSFNNYNTLYHALHYDFVMRDRVDSVIIHHGGAAGADTLARRYAEEENVPQRILLPDWAQYGKKAGMLRNEALVRDCEEVWAFWDGESKGTKNSIDWALRLKKNLHVVFFKKEEQ